MENLPEDLQALQATSRLVLNPNRAPYSERNHQTRPDGYMVLDKSSVPEDGKSDVHYWEDLGMMMEFKKGNNNNDRSDVRPASIIDSNDYWLKKQVFSMQQVMTYDPSWRFTFGLTIEDADTRLWFCSRSAMIVSEKVDFNEVCIVFSWPTYRTDLFSESQSSNYHTPHLYFRFQVGSRVGPSAKWVWGSEPGDGRVHAREWWSRVVTEDHVRSSWIAMIEWGGFRVFVDFRATYLGPWNT